MSTQSSKAEPTTQKDETNDELEWLYDSLIGFLKSPMWQTPIKTFIDENCIIFDCEQENKFAYTEVHQVRNINHINRNVEIYQLG